MRLAEPVRPARVEQDALSRRRLARVDVSHNPDVAGPFQRKRSCHRVVPLTALPAVVRKGFVRFSHAVRVFTLLDGAALTLRSVQQFVGQSFNHRLILALARKLHDPAQRQCRATFRPHLERHLVRRATNAAGTTSSTGMTLRTALSSTSVGSSPVRSLIKSNAPYTIVCARLFFPSRITLLMS